MQRSFRRLTRLGPRVAAQQCSEGWSQVGEACLRINSSRESYDNAQHYCKNLNGNIASLTTSKQVDFVLEELKKLQQQEKVNRLDRRFGYVLLWVMAAGNGTFFFFKGLLRSRVMRCAA